jgi:hypothetical protein
LLSKIKDTVVVIDYPGPLPYTTSGGILFGNFLNGNVDEFDLNVPWTPFTRYADMLYPEKEPMHGGKLPPPNPAIKALVINYCSKGYPGVFFPQQLPTLVVGAQADLFAGCPQNTKFMSFALKVDDLKKAIEFGMHFGKTKNILTFDGAMGGFNVNAPMAELMRKLAPEVSKEVEEKLMPMWLSQRGVSL